MCISCFDSTRMYTDTGEVREMHVGRLVLTVHNDDTSSDCTSYLKMHRMMHHAVPKTTICIAAVNSRTFISCISIIKHRVNGTQTKI